MERNLLLREVNSLLPPNFTSNNFRSTSLLDSELTPGRDSFVRNIISVTDQEYKRWRNGNLKEDTTEAKAFLGEYWMTGTGLSRDDADKRVRNKSAWSAAFISWIMKKAGAGNGFYYTGAHYGYIKNAKKNRREKNTNKPFWAYRISELKPQIGDIICNARIEKDPLRNGADFDNIESPPSKAGWATHGDIVVGISGNTATVMGGNTADGFGGLRADTVGKKTVPLDANGYVKLKGVPLKEYFAIIRLVTDDVEFSPTKISTGSSSKLSYFQKSSGTVLTSTLIGGGNRDINQLTNEVFYHLFPDRKRAKLAKGDPLVAVWLEIRDSIVQPVLATGKPKSPTTYGSVTDWTKTPLAERRQYVMSVLIKKYNYPRAGAAGIVGNLESESAIVPNRIEGSKSDKPMETYGMGPFKRNEKNEMKRTRGTWKKFTPEEIMDRSIAGGYGPLRPGIGLAQWTSLDRRKGLFKHIYLGKQPGGNILFDMDAQIDYLVHELQKSYKPLNKILLNPGISVEQASDSFLSDFERPKSIIYDGGDKAIIITRKSSSVPADLKATAIKKYNERARQAKTAFDNYRS